MAKIPQVSDSRVQLSEIPGGKQKTTGDVVPFGGAVAKAVQQTGNTLGEVAKVEHQIEMDRQIRYDETFVRDMDTKYAQTLEKNKNEYLKQRGRNALGAYDAAVKANEDARKELEKTLENDRQRRMWKRAADSRSLSQTKLYNNHRRNEQRRWEEETSKARQINQQREAANNHHDEVKAITSMVVGENEIKQSAARNGWGKERLKYELDTYRSGTIKGIIYARLNAKNTAGAKAFYSKYSEMMTPDVRAQVKRALESESRLADAQAATDKIMSDPKTTDQQKLEQARKIKDAETRAKAVQLVKVRLTEKDYFKRKSIKEATDLAWSEYKHSGYSLDSISRELWHTLPVPERLRLEAYDKARQSGKAIATNWTRYTKLRTMASDNPKKFAKLDLTRERMQLADPQYIAMVNEQQRVKKALRDGTGNGLKEVYGVNNQIKQRMNELGFKSNDPVRARYEDAIRTGIAEQEEKLKRKLDREERQKIIDRITVEGAKDWFGPYNPSARWLEVRGTEGETFFIQNLQVPQNHKTRITALLKKRRIKNINDDMIKMYRAIELFGREKAEKAFPQMKGAFQR